MSVFFCRIYETGLVKIMINAFSFLPKKVTFVSYDLELRPMVLTYEHDLEKINTNRSNTYTSDRLQVRVGSRG